MEYPGVDEKAFAGGDKKRLPACRYQNFALGDHYRFQFVVPVPGAGDIFKVQVIPVAGCGKQRGTVGHQLTAMGIGGGATGHQGHDGDLLWRFCAIKLVIIS